MWNRQTIEAALDAGKLEAAMHGGKWWRVRRNGATKLWATRPDHFRIPVKAGLRACAYITHDNMNAGHWRLKAD